MVHCPHRLKERNPGKQPWAEPSEIKSQDKRLPLESDIYLGVACHGDRKPIDTVEAKQLILIGKAVRSIELRLHTGQEARVHCTCRYKACTLDFPCRIP